MLVIVIQFCIIVLFYAPSNPQVPKINLQSMSDYIRLDTNGDYIGNTSLSKQSVIIMYQ